MVGAIQKWRKTQPQEAQILWSNLQQSNTNVESGLLQLKTIAKEHADEYTSAIDACQQESAEQVSFIANTHSILIASIYRTKFDALTKIMIAKTIC